MKIPFLVLNEARRKADRQGYSQRIYRFGSPPTWNVRREDYLGYLCLGATTERIVKPTKRT